jgi:uncharacterized membrane protein
MSSLIVLTFDNMDEAARVRSSLNELQKAGRLKMQDAAVIVKDTDGKVKVHGEASSDSKGGAIIGGVLGLMLGLIFFPIAGLAIGALGGALVGHSLGRNVDKKFVQDVEKDMGPGTSALFILMGDDTDPTATLAALRQYPGKVYHTNLDPEMEADLRKTMEKNQAAQENESGEKAE